MTRLASARRWALGAAVLIVGSGVAAAQSRYAPAPPNGGPVLRQPAAHANYVNAHGEPIIHPAMYGAPCGPAGCEPGYGGPAYGPGGGGGYTPFPGKAMNTEQCGPHYFDFAAEFLHLNRDSPIADDTVVSTFGFANDDLANVPDLAALTGADVGGGDYDGFRLTGRLDVGALSVFELSYAGVFTDESAVSVVPDTGGTITPGVPIDDNPLFSIFSRFGTATNGPVGDVGSAGAPTGDFFEETDAALEHSYRFDSELHSVEASFRRYWVGFNPRISGTLLAGFRYTELQELIDFRSMSSAGSIDIGLGADNRLAGVQIGGDVWASIVQGFRIGGEIKAGLYNNDHEVQTSAVASDGTPDSGASLNNNQVAFLTEMKAMAVVNVTPSLSIRGGYEILYISDLALVEDNLTAVPPYGEASLFGAAAPGLDAEGDVFWDGFNVGLEYTY